MITVRLLMAVILFALFSPVGRVEAQQLPCSINQTCDQGEANVSCMKHAPANASITKVTRRNCIPTVQLDGTGHYVMQYWGLNINGYEVGAFTDGNFYFKSQCSKRNQTFPPGDAALWYSEPPTCVGGCKIAGVGFSQDNGGVKVFGMHSRYYTGDTCTLPLGPDGIGPPDDGDKQKEGNKPKPDECTALGSGQTACSKPNGDQCATASTGKTFCWKPGQEGNQRDGNDSQGRSKKGKPVEPPPTPPAPDKEWQRTEGHQNTACVNTTCTTYNITNFQGVGSGQSKNSTGDNTTDGSGNTSGNGAPGKGSGSGGKDGDGDSASDSGNCEAAPACVGDTLKCLHLKFTWKIQCNTKQGQVTGGDGCGEGDVPVCAGDSCKAAVYASVLQQWKQRCAAQEMGQGMASRAAGISNPDDDGVVDGIWIDAKSGAGPSLRQDLVNVGGGGSLLPDITLEGVKWEIPQGFYDAIAAIRMVIIAMCTVMAMFIVGRNI